VIVVGSGPSAASAAWPLVSAGITVLMLDVGHEDSTYAGIIPPASFLENRRRDDRQHRYFLGDDFEGVPLGKVRVGAQLTPPRQHIARDTDRLTPLSSSTFLPTESLALGGLGSGWGASSVQFDDVDMEGWPIRAADLAPHYESAASRIGVSGGRDDLFAFYGACGALQPPLEIDDNGRALLARYASRRGEMNEGGLYMGSPRLAVLTRDLDGRRATRYGEMDFYADTDRSVYRPWMTVEKMRSMPGFAYERPWLVKSFRELPGLDRLEVIASHAQTGDQAIFTCRRLVLGAGAMGTARIVLRSFGLFDRPLPILSNAHVYVPCINLPMLGKPMSERRHSLTQVGLIFDPNKDRRGLVYAEAHGYRSLLLFKLAKEAFLPVPEAVRTFRDLMSALLILVIEHEDRPAPGKTCRLRRGGARPGPDDHLEVDYQPALGEAAGQRAAERRMLRLVRRLSCWPLQRIDPGHGASIHYGGALPMSSRDQELTTTPACLLRGTRGVYLVDGSVLPSLPAKPLTLTLMANGERVGCHLAGQMT